MNKKAQIFGEPFIFIFAIIVAAMVLMFGIKIYYDLSERADFAQVADIAQRINENIITFFNLEEGSSSNFKYIFPSNVECFCFVGNDDKADDPTLNAVLKDHCIDDAFKNSITTTSPPTNKVFWKYSEKHKGENPATSLPNKYFIRSTFDTTTTPPNYPLCIDLVQEKYTLKIRLESQGNKVLVSKAP